MSSRLTSIYSDIHRALVCHLGSLVLGMSSEVPYKVLLHNGQHFSLRALARRYISTTKQVLSWYQTDIFDPRTEGKSAQTKRFRLDQLQRRALVAVAREHA